MLHTIRQDLNQITKKNSIIIKLKVAIVSHSFHLVLFYRIGCALSSIPIAGSLFRPFLEYIIRIIFSSDISLKSKIGQGLVFVHGHDIVIGSCVTIGQNCKILNGVTLGNKDTEINSSQQPTIGDNVVIGSGAKLLGQITIGNNVVIGANSVVLQSFESNRTIAGVPARILK